MSEFMKFSHSYLEIAVIAILSQVLSEKNPHCNSLEIERFDNQHFTQNYRLFC